LPTVKLRSYCVAMAQDDSWQERTTRVIAGQLRRYRLKRGLSAQQLSDECTRLGFPIPRSVLANLENGRRESVSTAELQVLAAALDVSPVMLLFPVGVAATVEVLPGRHENAVEALARFAGKDDPDVERFMLHRELLARTAGGEGPTPTGIMVGSMSEEERRRWRQDVVGEQVLRQIRESIRDHGLTPPELPAGLAWIDDKASALRSPRPAVVAAIVTSAKGVLVGRRNDGIPPWTFIAGEQEPGELPEDTAIREVKEETGLEVRAGDVIGERAHPATGRTMIYMAARPVRGTKVIVGDEEELAEVRWVSLAEADELLPGMFGAVREHLGQELGDHGSR
jgi:8-oxo-dGTP diphosphatase